MKRIICFLLFIYGASVYANKSSLISHHNSFLPPGDTVQVFLGIGPNDPDVVVAVRGALATMAGVSVLAYCDGHAVFMINLIPNSSVRSDGELLSQLKDMLPKQASTLGLKQGVFSDFYKYCIPTNSSEALNIKNLN